MGGRGTRGGGGTRSWLGTALLAAALLAAVAALLRWSPWSAPGPAPGEGGDPQATELAHLQALGRALRFHADEHDGKYPDKIADIQWRQGQPGLEWSGLPAAASRFHVPGGNGRVMDWLYYAGHTESDPPETILVASPVAVGAGRDQRLVTRIGNVTEVIAESDFQRQAAPGP